MKMWRHLPFIVTLSILPGCAGQSAQPAAVANPRPSPESVRVCLIVDPRSDLPWAGSGVPIGDNSIATCLHVLRLPVSSVSIDGHLVPVEVSASSGAWHSTNPDGTIAHGDDWGDVSRDWLQFTARAGTFQPSPDSSIDFNRPVDVGEPIFLIGFAGDASRMDRESVNRLTPIIVAGRVV